MYTVRKDGLFESGKALVIGLFHENKRQQPVYQELNERLNHALDVYIQNGDVSNDYKHISKVYTLNLVPVERIYVVGLGKKKELTTNKLKNAFGALAKRVKQDGVEELRFALSSFTTNDLTDSLVTEALAEAVQMAPYEFEHYKTMNERPSTRLLQVELVSVEDEQRLLQAAKKGEALGHGVNTARHLVQLPGNLLTATDMAAFARSLAEEHGFEIEVLEKEDMQQLGMGALLAVNQGSTEPPKMIVLRYQGKEVWQNAIGLVGKGITFDTGGYSIKTKEGIVGMKGDMGGAAAVLGAMDTIGRLRPKQNVVAVIPSTDNMISGGAMKPDDVITSLSGKTIEVLNTDAEGRLALADGITYAKHHKAEKVIDVATLTGGVIVALGDGTTGAMTNNASLYGEIETASKVTDEPIWQLPYNKQYRDKVRSSELADLNNSPGRKAHAIMAGAFLAEFAEQTPWVHLDIAGTAQSDTATDLGPKGPTGVMSRTLATYILGQ
ncbi:aminopeptidase A [Pontibacillus halophilus JSM 076056 = DSM 19796]|uniref:Probable cytosol aminopeptidase n=1 Tax=Pontibacillus halophilus JSM 076056 = DSM 19796 TaxID=1385510 RepID=A0A0A5G8Y7_9BACI|nr:leucyl aminopeptidase [Pontibacillus halophilus]KGX89611.1 aminopeptidase A [Pontibacillus halophilus JSM 076056 = DSM 19796]